MCTESEQVPAGESTVLGTTLLPSALPLSLGRADAITRGALRLLLEMDYSPVTEVTLANGRRADILAVDRKGVLLIVEVKSSVADFQSDRKWPDYLPFCDSFYFAVDPAFPAGRIPEDCGLMVADPYGAAILRPAVLRTIAAPRRKAVTLNLARCAAERVARAIVDPNLRPPFDASMTVSETGGGGSDPVQPMPAVPVAARLR